jgi:tRNA dimethylallyltransferase
LSVKSSQNYRAIALMGATGTGKSALALEIAQQCHTSIISCDSMQLYRGLDIGTAKASKAEQSIVPHYLIDCADVQEIWSAQRWADAAIAIIKSENAQGRVPLIVGGTGMYLRALIEGFAPIPDEKEGIREHFIGVQEQKGTPFLHALLEQCDPVLAQRLHPTDTQRIMRGLCIYESTGTPLSTWQSKQKHQAAQCISCPVYVLELPRPELRERLARRIDAMMAAGWLDEVKWLSAQPVDAMHPALRAVGYRQLLAHIHGECDLDKALADAITASRKYAKRQVTWFRNQTPNAVKGEHQQLKTAILEQFKQWT